jgi:hypothetical protein
LAVTFAPTTGAPEGSVTVPRMAPVTSWLNAGTAATNNDNMQADETVSPLKNLFLDLIGNVNSP